MMMESEISSTGVADSECDSIDVVNSSPVGSKKKVKILDPFEFFESTEADSSKRERPPYKLLTMESPVSSTGVALHADCECDSIDVVNNSPVGSKKKVKILDPFEFLESPEADASKREYHPYKRMKMESQISPTGGALYGDSNCDSITSVSSKKKVKILDPFEFLESPEADSSKREHPPYKSILKHLPSEDTALLATIPQCKEENGIQSTLPTMACPAQWHPQSAVIPSCNPGPNGLQELPAFAMSNPGAPEAGAIVPYVGLAGDGTPFFISSNGVIYPAATGEMPAHQIHTPGSGLPQGMVVAASSTTLHIPQQMAEEATRKREMRLMKNREAARECRKKKKEYVKCLENRVAVLENQNKTLIEELKALKDLYCHKAE